jgi:hypothetical protein
MAPTFGLFIAAASLGPVAPRNQSILSGTTPRLGIVRAGRGAAEVEDGELAS